MVAAMAIDAGLKLMSRNELQQLGQDCVMMGHGMKPPCLVSFPNTYDKNQHEFHAKITNILTGQQ